MVCELELFPTTAWKVVLPGVILNLFWAEFTPSATLPWAIDFIEHALRLLQVP
jgi:hypothetical protein